LNLFGVRQQLPLTLALLRDYTSKRLSLKQLKESLWTLEAFYFVYVAVVSQRPSGGFGMMFARFGREMANAKDAQAKANVIKELREKFSEMRPSYQVFRASCSLIRFSDVFTRQKKLVQYILRRITLHHSPHSSVDFAKLTIEHIASQSSIGTSGVNENHVGEIGNLMLVNTDVNSGQLADKPFSKKKPLLLKHGLYDDVYIGRSSIWGADQISERTDALAKLAYESIWQW
jgi:hypothetical protein